MSKMNREKAIAYLDRKGEIEGETEYSDKEERKIKEVMNKGKIYGDPVVDFS